MKWNHIDDVVSTTHDTPKSHRSAGSFRCLSKYIKPSLLRPGSTLPTTELQDVFPLLDEAVNDNDTADDCSALWVKST